jgi:hypothetical protein
LHWLVVEQPLPCESSVEQVDPVQYEFELHEQ